MTTIRFEPCSFYSLCIWTHSAAVNVLCFVCLSTGGSGYIAERRKGPNTSGTARVGSAIRSQVSIAFSHIHRSKVS